jgi:hypothetical protein
MENTQIEQFLRNYEVEFTLSSYLNILYSCQRRKTNIKVENRNVKELLSQLN